MDGVYICVIFLLLVVPLLVRLSLHLWACVFLGCILALLCRVRGIFSVIPGLVLCPLCGLGWLLSVFLAGLLVFVRSVLSFLAAVFVFFRFLPCLLMRAGGLLIPVRCLARCCLLRLCLPVHALSLCRCLVFAGLFALLFSFLSCWLSGLLRPVFVRCLLLLLFLFSGLAWPRWVFLAIFRGGALSLVFCVISGVFPFPLAFPRFLSFLALLCFLRCLLLRVVLIGCVLAAAALLRCALFLLLCSVRSGVSALLFVANFRGFLPTFIFVRRSNNE